MTNKEYLQSAFERFGISEQLIDLILVENELEAEEQVQVRLCKEASWRSFSHWLPVQTQISEGGVSQSWSSEAVRTYYGILCRELGKENILETQERHNQITDKSYLW